MNLTPRDALAGRSRFAAISPQRALEAKYLGVWVALIALIALSAVIAPAAATLDSIKGELPAASFLALAALGQTLVLMNRGIDLSVAGTVTLSAFMIVQQSPSSDGEMAVAIGLVLAVALAIGLVNGALIGIARLNPIIVTLGMNAIVLGVALLSTSGGIPDGRAYPGLSEFMVGRTLGIPNPALIAVAVVLALTAVLRLSVIGRRFIFNGANPRAAHVVGIETRRYDVSVYVIGAMLYACAGIMIAGYAQIPSIDVGNPYLFGTIAAAVVGGTALTGGKGSLVATLGGALFLTQISLMINVLGVSAGIGLVAQATIIVVSLGLRPALERARAWA